MVSVANDAMGTQVNPDWTEFNTRMASIRSRRKTMTTLVREHLAKVGPLEYEKFGKPDTLAT